MHNSSNTSQFVIKYPTIISFSGGRTSGMMLRYFLDANNGLPDLAKVVFANTGKERPETLDFVNECSLRWNIPIIWLEYQTHEQPQKRWKEVTYHNASRNGEPFEALIQQKNFLPNPLMRFCSIELKIRVAKLYAQQSLNWKNWDVAIGFRSDEPTRLANLLIPNKEPFERFAPLASMGVSKHDVAEFWKSQNFDLKLPNINGVTFHGNCDLCFLKGEAQTVSLIQEHPAAADWWVKMENHPNFICRFRKDRAPYKTLRTAALDQTDLFNYSDFNLSDCACTD